MTPMDDGLKQRLLGALILLALAVIFIPVLFDRERMEPIDTTSQVPPRPAVKMLEVPEPRKPAWSEPVTAPRQQFVPEADSSVPDTFESTAPVVADGRTERGTEGAAKQNNDRNMGNAGTESGQKSTDGLRDSRAVKDGIATEKAGTLAADGTPNAWVLQVGSFQSEALAISMRDRVIGMGHSSYLHRFELDGKPVFRVYVGPKMKKAPLEKMKPEIDKTLQVNSLLLKFKAG